MVVAVVGERAVVVAVESVAVVGQLVQLVVGRMDKPCLLAALLL